MLAVKDYKQTSAIALDIMKSSRKKLFDDVMKHNSTIFEGLHEFSSDNVRDLYFDAYTMEWLDSHWKELTEHLKLHSREYSSSEQCDITLFFANFFSDFIMEFDNGSDLSKIATHELIKAKRESLDQMLLLSSEWEERSNKMRVELKKNKEHFKRLIDNAKKTKEE